jgi:hypothetical protein
MFSWHPPAPLEGRGVLQDRFDTGGERLLRWDPGGTRMNTSCLCRWADRLQVLTELLAIAE